MTTHTSTTSSSPRVLFVSEYWPPFAQGGGEISMSILAEGLAKEGVIVDVLTSKAGGSRRMVAGRRQTNDAPDSSAQSANYELRTTNYELSSPIARYLSPVTIHSLCTTGRNPSSPFSNIKRSLFFARSVKKNVKRLTSLKKYDTIVYANTTSAYGFVPIKGMVSVCHVNSPAFFSPTRVLIYPQDKNYSCPSSFSDTIKAVLHSPEIGKMSNVWWLRYNPLVWLLLHLSFKKGQRVLKQFDYYHAVSEFMKRCLLACGVNEKKVFVVPNIVDLEAFKNARLHVTGDRLRSPLHILYLGAYTRNKGVMTLLEASKLLHNGVCKTVEGRRWKVDGGRQTAEGGWEMNASQDASARSAHYKLQTTNYKLSSSAYCQPSSVMPFTVNFYGEGPLLNEMQEFVERNNLMDVVRIHDKIAYSEVPSVMVAHDVIVMPSLIAESFGRPLIEAQAAGLRVIAARVGAMPELVSEDCLFTPGDAQEIVEKIRATGSRQTGSGGRKKEGLTIKKYSERRIVQQICTIYKGAVKRMYG